MAPTRMAEVVKSVLTWVVPWYDRTAEQRATERTARLVHRAEVTRRYAILRAYREASQRLQR